MAKNLQRDRVPTELTVTQTSEPTFNFALTLPGRASSRHTQRAYFRWVDRYLADVAGLPLTSGAKRVRRMHALPVNTLVASLSAPQLRAWLGILSNENHGKQGLGQARAAIITLASLLSEAGLMDDYTSAAMTNVRAPKAEDGQRPGRWLSMEQIKMLIAAAQGIATSGNQRLRNHLVVSILCTMALRREELAAATWGDLTLQNNRVVLRVHGKGRKAAMIDVPRPMMTLLNQWRQIVAQGQSAPPPDSPLVRRIWKGGGISPNPMTADGIWLLVAKAAEEARIGHVAPHDLRRSVAGALQEGGTSIEKISLLLRHSNVAVTERYLSRLPQRNEGAILMSDMLGLDDMGEPDWFE
jgi:integrase